MSHRELQVRWVAGIAVLAVIAIPLIFRGRSSLIHARMAESGGWSPSVLKAVVGEPMHLRLTSDDVVHGFAVGRVNMESVDILPGKATDVTLTFDKPGTYTFYCTRWCGIDHWRMRGTVEVTGGDQGAVSAISPPLYVSLGIDLDAPRSTVQIPAARPVADIASKQLSNDLAQFESAAYYRSHSPSEAWQDLRRDPAFPGKSDAELWSLTASIWRSSTTPEALAQGERLFAQNCAACHGEQGRGDGVFSDALAAAGAASTQAMTSDQMGRQRPADFADPQRLLTASPALLQGKILRGGMGTGMPSWGPIFTEEETWNLVAYLYTFQFSYR